RPFPSSPRHGERLYGTSLALTLAWVTSDMGRIVRARSFSIILCASLLTYVIPMSVQAQRHDLYYVDRHGQVFILEQTFPTPAECERAARAMYESKQVSGVACKPTTPRPRGLEEAQPVEHSQQPDEKRPPLRERVDKLAEMCDKLAAQGWRAPEYHGGPVADGSRYKDECIRAWRERDLGVGR